MRPPAGRPNLDRWCRYYRIALVASSRCGAEHRPQYGVSEIQSEIVDLIDQKSALSIVHQMIDHRGSDTVRS